MLKISLDFLKSLPNLPFERLRKIPKFVQMLHGNPNLPSLRLEHLASVDLYSARIDDSYRAILCRRGADYILLRADKREELIDSRRNPITLLDDGLRLLPAVARVHPSLR